MAAARTSTSASSSARNGRRCDCVCQLLRKAADGLTLRCDADVLAAVLPPACEFERTAGSND